MFIDVFIEYQAKYPHTLTVETVYAAVEEDEQRVTALLKKSLDEGAPLEDSDILETPPGVYI